MCDKFYITLWSDPDIGINFQKWRYDDTPMGGIINVDSATYYSDHSKISIDMNSGCMLAIGYINHFSAQSRVPTITNKTKVYRYWSDVSESWGFTITSSYSTSLPNDIVTKSWDPILFDNGGPSVSVNDSGGMLTVYQQPACRYQGGNSYMPWFCDNYVYSSYLSGTNSSIYFGEYRPTHPYGWHHSHAGRTVNIPPYMDHCSNPGHPEQCSNGCGNKGGAYDCPYYVSGYLTEELAIIGYMEYAGNRGTHEYYGTSDDPTIRIFRLSDGQGTRELRVSNSPNTLMYDDWGIECTGRNGANEAVCVWMNRVPEDQRVSDIMMSKLWISSGPANVCWGSFCYVDGGSSGVYSVANQFTSGDQINPSVRFSSGDNNYIVAWESSNSFHQNGAGGYGVYLRYFDTNLNPMTKDIRMNDNNTIKIDWQEYDPNGSDYCGLRSDHIGLDCNKNKECYVAWTNPDYQCTNCDPIYSGYASHGKGYEVKSAVLTDCGGANTIEINNGSTFTSIQLAYASSSAVDYLNGRGTYNENLRFDRMIDLNIYAGKYECGTTITINGNIELVLGTTIIESGTVIVQ